MKKKVINNLARRLQKKYPRLYSSMGTKRVKKILNGVLGETVFHRNDTNIHRRTTNNYAINNEITLTLR